MTGHQVVEDWMGQEVTTLADLIPSPCRVLVVGINPAPASVAAGHYYQGPARPSAPVRKFDHVSVAAWFRQPA